MGEGVGVCGFIKWCFVGVSRFGGFSPAAAAAAASDGVGARGHGWAHAAWATVRGPVWGGVGVGVDVCGLIERWYVTGFGR